MATRQDQKQHVLISIFSLIIGNQFSDRANNNGAREALLPDTEPAALTAGETADLTEGEAALALVDQPAETEKPSLRSVIGRAIGLLLLAWLVSCIFGKRAEPAPRDDQ